TSLPPLPGAAPPLPPPPPTLPPPAAVAKAAPAQAAPPPAPATAVPPQLALPGSPPPPRLAETTPAPPAAAPPPPAAKTAAAPAEAPTQATAPETLPKGADSLTLPFSPQQSDLPGAENAILRNFAQRYGPGAEYIIRAFASAPAGDNDPSTPRRTSLARAQTVAAALAASGVPQKRVRLLALGDTGGKIADRVQVIAMPPASRHTASDSSP
ncbi:MAG: hypothetical protein HIU92_17270, partial [Proteobacteria bacterium]|nr:hypothetical protein [Pseudomonadota bacterium]